MFCSIANNEDLCGVGIKPCGHLKGGTKAGIIVGVLLGSLLAALAIYIFYKRRQNIARAQRLRKPLLCPFLVDFVPH